MLGDPCSTAETFAKLPNCQWTEYLSSLNMRLVLRCIILLQQESDGDSRCGKEECRCSRLAHTLSPYLHSRTILEIERQSYSGLESKTTKMCNRQVGNQCDFGDSNRLQSAGGRWKREGMVSLMGSLRRRPSARRNDINTRRNQKEWILRIFLSCRASTLMTVQRESCHSQCPVRSQHCTTPCWPGWIVWGPKVWVCLQGVVRAPHWYPAAVLVVLVFSLYCLPAFLVSGRRERVSLCQLQSYTTIL
jgi:hypothetical protein